MRTGFTIATFSMVFSLYSTGILAQDDDCHIDLEDAGINAKLTDSSDVSGKTQISIMFSNASENNYEVPVVRIDSCEFIKSEVLFPEMGNIKAGETITQSYLCGSGFRSDSVAIKMYLKAPSDEAATSACTTISPAPQQTSTRGSLPGNNDPNKIVAVVSSCDFRTETCGVTVNGKEDYIPYGDLYKVIPMYKGSLKDPVYCDGPICYKAFLETDAIGLNPEFDWNSISPTKPEQPVQQASEDTIPDNHDYTSQVNYVLSSNSCKSGLGGDVAFETFKLEANRIGVRQVLSTRTQQYGMPGSYTVLPISSNGAKCTRISITPSKSLPGVSGVNYTDAVYQCTGSTPFIVIKVGRSIQGTANGFRSECEVIKI